MDSVVAILGLGFLLGLRHALDADHLIAVSTIVTEQRAFWRSSLIGAFWGLGHTLSLSAVGVAVILFRLTIHERVAFWLEMGVALMLIFLGSRLLIRSLRLDRWHVHAHQHGDVVHSHIHSHPQDQSQHEDSHHHLSTYGRLPILVGMVHGLAGSAALMLLVLATITSPWQAALYILLFGVGSITGMFLMSTLVSLPLSLLARRFGAVSGGIRILAGLTSVVFGLVLAAHLINA